MTDSKDTSTEQNILKAAEDVFLSKGYAAAKTTEIAKLAGVNHAMLHYYFRTKANLFDQVFTQKLLLFASSFDVFENTELSFLEKIQIGVESHFDFLAANPKLANFIINEVLANEEKKIRAKKILLPKIATIISLLHVAITKEAEKGTIIPINPVDLLLNIGSLNIFSIIASQTLFSMVTKDQSTENLLQQRRKNNVRVILKSLEK